MIAFGSFELQFGCDEQRDGLESRAQLQQSDLRIESGYVSFLRIYSQYMDINVISKASAEVVEFMLIVMMLKKYQKWLRGCRICLWKIIDFIPFTG